MPATECEALAKSTTANAAGRQSAAQGKRSSVFVSRQRGAEAAGDLLQNHHKPRRSDFSREAFTSAEI